MSEKALFKIGGVYRQQGGDVVHLQEAREVPAFLRSDYEGTAVARVFFTWGGGCGFRRLDNGRLGSAQHDSESRFHLVPGELVKRNGEWVPLESTPATIGPFGSGATLQTDGSKIVGRTEAQPIKSIGAILREQMQQPAPDAEAAQKSRDVRPRTAREAIFAINVAMHEAWDAAAQSAKSRPHPSPFAAKTLFRSPDIGGTSHLHGSAHLLSKG